MPRYKVTYYYHSAVEVEIDAEDADTAINDARRRVTTHDVLTHTQEIDNGAELINSVEETKNDLDRMPRSFVEAITDVFGLVPETTPSWDSVIVPFAYDPANLDKIKKMFDAVGLSVTDEAIKAVQSEYKMSAAFLHDYGDICEGLEQLKVEDLDDIWELSIQKVIQNIIKYNDSNYDPVLEVMKAFHDGNATLFSCVPQNDWVI